MSREIVEESLGPEDKTQRSYEGRLDRDFGILSMSKRKLIFITEKGIFRKSYNMVLDLPYKKIESIRTEGKYNLIIETEDLKHTFVSPSVRVPSAEETLRELMEQEPSLTYSM